MKKFFIQILLLLALTSCMFAQWSPRQQQGIDSLWLAIDSLGTSSLPPLSQGFFWVGNAEGYPSSRVMSGDATLDYLGVLTIGSAKITNTKVATGIDATKIGGGTISNTEFSCLDGATSNLQAQIYSFVTGSGMIAKDLATKQTSTSEIYFSEDGIRYVPSAYESSPVNVRAGIPVFLTDPTLSTMYFGDIYYLGNQTDTDGSGELLHTIKLVGRNADVHRELLTFWDSQKTQRVINEAISYEYPEVVTATTDTLNFRMNNYIATRYTVPSNTTIYISNSSPGWVSFVVNGTLNTVSILAKNNAAASTWGTIKWTNGIAPTFTNTYAVYQVNLQRIDADEIIGSWVFHQ